MASTPKDQDREHHAVPAMLVAAGMLLSRISGFARSTLFTKAFGLENVASDAFYSANAIPNFLQNLFGEGALSASLVPVYSGLLKHQQQEEADRVARAVLGLLALLVGVLVLIGVTFTPYLIAIVAPGFKGEARELTIRLVRIMFPGIALLVCSAWCLAILNSHGRFFLAYFAPVLWNVSMIVTLVFGRGEALADLAVKLSWAAVVGGALQLGIQVPAVWRIMAPSWTTTKHTLDEHVRRVLRTSVPVIFARGVVQVSAYIDNIIVTYLPVGARSALFYATQLYQLPVSLFGMAVSSAALPSLSAAVAAHVPELLRERLLSSQRAIAVLVIPSMIGFLCFGDIIAGLLFQRGRFTHDDAVYVWGVLAGSAVGLLATTIARLYSAAFYALGDTKTPMRFAVIRVVLVIALGWIMALYVPPLFGIEARWGTAGLTISAGLAGWIEFALLRSALQKRIGAVAIPPSFLFKTWLVATIVAIPVTGLRWVIPVDAHIVRGITIVGVYAGLYLVAGDRLHLLRLEDVLRRVMPRRKAT